MYTIIIHYINISINRFNPFQVMVCIKLDTKYRLSTEGVRLCYIVNEWVYELMYECAQESVCELVSYCASELMSGYVRY